MGAISGVEGIPRHFNPWRPGGQGAGDAPGRRSPRPARCCSSKPPAAAGRAGAAGCSFVQPGELPHTHRAAGPAAERVKEPSAAARGALSPTAPAAGPAPQPHPRKPRPGASPSSRRPSPGGDGALGVSPAPGAPAAPRAGQGRRAIQSAGSGRAGGTL